MGSPQGLLHSGRVSVVIPVHNGMPHIKQALESALSQDYDDLEILVVENDSDDGTDVWLREIRDPRLKIVRQPSLVPVERNFSDAVAQASGEFVRLLCADDFLKPGAVRAHVEGFLQHPEAVLVASTRDICDERGKTIIRNRGLDGLAEVNTRADVVSACGEYGTNVVGEPFCRTAALQAELPFNSKHRFVLDIELYIRALRYGPLVTISGSYSTFRVGSSSYSAAASNSQASQFSAWFESLQDEPDLGVSAEIAQRAARQARKNQRARAVVYRLLAARDRLRRLTLRRRVES